MNCRKSRLLFSVPLFLILGCAFQPDVDLSDSYAEMRRALARKFRDEKPMAWGEKISGVKTRLKTQDPIIALALDACGSKGDGFDRDLIDFLRAEKVPTTIFANARWIDKNRAQFDRLVIDPLFKIENHGLLHRPASVSGHVVYGIEGTRNVEELVDEVELSARKIERMTGRKPKYFRAGTDYYDDVAIQVIHFLGYEVIGFSLLGDKGATSHSYEVYRAFLAAKPGDIIIAHMNHPEKETAEGALPAIRKLKQRGFKFVHLSDYSLE